MPSRPPISLGNKQIAKVASEALGGAPQINFFDHDSEDLAIALLQSRDRPSKGLTSYATLLVSDSPMIDDGKEFPTRVEFVGACDSSVERFPNVLAAAAFMLMRTNRLIHPGAVLPNYVSEFIPTTTVPHLYFTAPFLWEEKLRTSKFGTKTVSWLLAMPISEREAKLLTDRGDDALEEALQAGEPDIFDVSRASVV